MIPRLVYGNSQAASEWESHCIRWRRRHQRRRFLRKLRRAIVGAAAALAVLAAGVQCAPVGEAAPASAAVTPQQTVHHEGLYL